MASDLATLKGGLTSISEQLKEPLGNIGAAGAVVDVAGPVTDKFQTVRKKKILNVENVIMND